MQLSPQIREHAPEPPGRLLETFGTATVGRLRVEEVGRDQLAGSGRSRPAGRSVLKV
jgi:hypothetical protein